jgi:hypothetical protein
MTHIQRTVAAQDTYSEILQIVAVEEVGGVHE